jgi:uncharacterized membrane protein (UPF0182 family)
LRQGQQDRQINYIRNSVKATVDAYDGTVTLYQWDSSDPVLKSWMKVFPGLVKPAGDMPSSVRSHVRYPEDLFDVQRGLLTQYHVDDPVAFYNGSDRWQVPEDPAPNTAGNQPPYYVLASPPNQDDAPAEFQLTSTMLVNNAPNMAAYISANCDPGPNYGRLTVLRISDKSAVQGPTQVATVFRTNTQIAPLIRLLNGGGGESTIIHGNLLTLPLGGSFLYVEPLYAASSYPALDGVILQYGNGSKDNTNNLGFGPTVTQALTDFLPGHTLGQTLPVFGQGGTGSNSGSGNSSSPPSSTSTSSSPPPSGSPLPTNLAAIVAELQTVRKQLHDTAGDNPVRIAELQQREQQLIDQLVKLQPSKSASPSGSPSPTK